ncbi:MAG: HAD family hydrolase [Firmicutes bacterium]|nr:HAD family hydrolase [Bacillota bacterium]MDD7601833.1 HAD family hydrolase [Bacillota bacterium]MDY5855846.1 HAD family hydrolase [Anaerovoracaceae bacterium]
MKEYKAAVFDLDGTLLETLEDLADSTNHALRTFGLPVRTTDEVCRFVGNGIHKLIERAVPEDSSSETVEQVYEEFKRWYAIHCNDKTSAYAGIEEMLHTLRQLGIRTAVVSNKADFAVQTLCKIYFPGLLDAAVGQRDGIRTKPAPDAVHEVLKILDISREDAVYVGDSDVDIETAANAGMDCISVTWGFRSRQFLIEHGACVLADTPRALQEYISSGQKADSVIR